MTAVAKSGAQTEQVEETRTAVSEEQERMLTESTDQTNARNDLFDSIENDFPVANGISEDFLVAFQEGEREPKTQNGQETYLDYLKERRKDSNLSSIERSVVETDYLLEKMSSGISAVDGESLVVRLPISKARHNGEDLKLSPTDCYRLTFDQQMEMTAMVRREYSDPLSEGNFETPREQQMHQRLIETKLRDMAIRLGTPIENENTLPKSIQERLQAITRTRDEMREDSGRGESAKGPEEKTTPEQSVDKQEKDQNVDAEVLQHTRTFLAQVSEGLLAKSKDGKAIVLRINVNSATINGKELPISPTRYYEVPEKQLGKISDLVRQTYTERSKRNQANSQRSPQLKATSERLYQKVTKAKLQQLIIQIGKPVLSRQDLPDALQ